MKLTIKVPKLIWLKWEGKIKDQLWGNITGKKQGRGNGALKSGWKGFTLGYWESGVHVTKLQGVYKTRVLVLTTMDLLVYTG